MLRLKATCTWAAKMCWRRNRLANGKLPSKGHQAPSHWLFFSTLSSFQDNLKSVPSLREQLAAWLWLGWPATGKKMNRFWQNRFLVNRFGPFFCAIFSWYKTAITWILKVGGGNFRMCRVPPLNKIKVSTRFCGLNKWLLQTAQNRAKMGSLGKWLDLQSFWEYELKLLFVPAKQHQKDSKNGKTLGLSYNVA